MFQCLSGANLRGFYGCVLCDSMGLGKTFQCIAVTWAMMVSGIHGHPTCKKAIVLCPKSLVQNWANEFHKWLEGKLKVVPVEPCTSSRFRSVLKDFCQYDTVKHKGRVLILSYSTYRIHAKEVRQAHRK